MEQQLEKIQRVERLNEMPEEWQALRTKILENFESKTDGMDIERVKDFMEERGLPVTDFVIFEEEDIPKFQKIFGETYCVEGLSAGSYLPAINIVFMRRNREMENSNGALYTEGILIHELSHGANAHTQFIKTEDSIQVSRSGFSILNEQENPWGWFLEEGFVDMMRGEYLEQNPSEEINENLNEKIRGMGLDPKTFSSATSETFLGTEFHIFRKYFTLTKGKIDWGLPPIAATGIEILCMKQPKIRKALLEARTDIKKLGEIPKLINAIKPGLYVEIQKCGYSSEDFARVQYLIKEAAQNSK